MSFQHHANIDTKDTKNPNDTIPRKCPDRQTGRRKGGWKDPISQDPPGYNQGSNKLFYKTGFDAMHFNCCVAISGTVFIINVLPSGSIMTDG